MILTISHKTLTRFFNPHLNNEKSSRCVKKRYKSGQLFSIQTELDQIVPQIYSNLFIKKSALRLIFTKILLFTSSVVVNMLLLLRQMK